MMEAIVVLLFKFTLGVATLAWTAMLASGHWVTALLAVPALVFLWYMLRANSGRRRGKRAEGSA